MKHDVVLGTGVAGMSCAHSLRTAPRAHVKITVLYELPRLCFTTPSAFCV